jgi:hypothetical protein
MRKGIMIGGPIILAVGAVIIALRAAARAADSACWRQNRRIAWNSADYNRRSTACGGASF